MFSSGEFTERHLWKCTCSNRTSAVPTLARAGTAVVALDGEVSAAAMCDEVERCVLLRLTRRPLW